MPNTIQLLPDHVANQIAAGEVVQRPASVVKELMENAIDAGATDIKLLIKDAGKNLVQVIDNGKGMNAYDAKLCFERHATSKIKNAQDLFNLHTKGFRGEALASIAAIAQVELKTKLEDEEVGTAIKIEGSSIGSQEVIACPKGTSIAVKNLFFNIPARRKFLKSDAIETRHIIDEFQRVALAHPQIAFSMHHNNNEVYHLTVSNLRKRVVAIFGSKMNEKLVPIDENTDILSLQGFVAKPNFAKKKRGEQFFFVNDRFIKNSYLNHAVSSAFEGLLEHGTYPSYFLYLTVPSDSIDINIHPTKTEIKFDNEKDLYAILRATVKHSLGQYNVAPVLDFNRDASLDVPYEYKEKKSYGGAPAIKIDPNFNPFASEPLHQEMESAFQREETTWEAHQSTITPYESNFQEELFDNQKETDTSKTFQIQRKYLLSSIKSGMVLIHQSLAHQRILYEDFLESITVKDAVSQQLLFPVSISFARDEIEMIKGIKSDLESVGFLFEEFEKETLIVKGIPTSLSESQITPVLEQLLDDIKQEVPDASFSHFDIMAKSFAKSLAIKTGATLNSKEQETLVNNLFSCKEPSVSPFGKTIFKTLTIKEIDAVFNSH
ncbi:DNA mismatch repair protein MutL [Polaribacter pacificus]|uniref:DNA mismatch repair protein MutL n=1 Tax=Polaribacter pacificus TaxID=1775173 RepID=A0A917MDS0_9FLAO|nr:DNA mismatch repair endonuclease MutL [Polaribacter pacificus]GGG99746.1 DNA mismatch repair protein MutL [Polaribacter pacificus]